MDHLLSIVSGQVGGHEYTTQMVTTAHHLLGAERSREVAANVIQQRTYFYPLEGDFSNGIFRLVNRI